MAGPQSPISPRHSHKLCNIVNITLILFTKAAIDCSHHQLHRDIHIKTLFLMVTQLINLGISYSFLNEFLEEYVRIVFWEDLSGSWLSSGILTSRMNGVIKREF